MDNRIIKLRKPFQIGEGIRRYVVVAPEHSVLEKNKKDAEWQLGMLKKRFGDYKVSKSMQDGVRKSITKLERMS